MLHSYDGGGIQVNGPALLVRKNVTTSTSVFYKHYVDNITSASIDVELGGSKYDEHRTEQSAGLDYLNGKTTMNISYTGSVENDYEAGTLDIGISQDFFGDLSTLTMGYSRGKDSVSKRLGSCRILPGRTTGLASARFLPKMPQFPLAGRRLQTRQPR